MSVLDYWNIAVEACGTTRTVLTLLSVVIFFIIAAISMCITVKFAIKETLELIEEVRENAQN